MSSSASSQIGLKLQAEGIIWKEKALWFYVEEEVEELNPFYFLGVEVVWGSHGNTHMGVSVLSSHP